MIDNFLLLKDWIIPHQGIGGIAQPEVYGDPMLLVAIPFIVLIIIGFYFYIKRYKHQSNQLKQVQTPTDQSAVPSQPMETQAQSVPTKFVETKAQFCPYCGTERIIVDAQFCANCGKSLNGQ